MVSWTQLKFKNFAFQKTLLGELKDKTQTRRYLHDMPIK